MTQTRSWYFRQLHRRPAVWLAWAAAVLYSSWPLGYILNPTVGKHDLASQLEALHQPYAWLFILMDVLTGVVATAAGIWQIRVRGRPKWLKWCALSYIVFGVFDAVSALAPLNCDPEAHDCGPLLHNPLLLIHGLSSIISPAFLGLGVFILGFALYRHRVGKIARVLFGITAVAWTLSAVIILFGTDLDVALNVAEYYFITVCSLSVVLVVGAIEHLHFINPEATEAKPKGVGFSTRKRYTNNQ